MARKEAKNFDVYDRVWVMCNNRPTEKIVFAVIISMNYYKNGTEIYYHLVESAIGAGWGNNEGTRVAHEDVYRDKKTLVEALMR